MKNLLAAVVGMLPLFVTDAVLAQNGSMMNGGMGGMGGGGWMGGYGGYWIPVLLVVLVGVVAWAIIQKRK